MSAAGAAAPPAKRARAVAHEVWDRHSDAVPKYGTGPREVVLRAALGAQDAVHERHFETRPIAAAALADGEIRVRAVYVSVDPYMFQYSLRDPQALGARVGARAVGVVEESKHSDYPAGCFVFGPFGWSTHAVVAPGGETRVFLPDGTAKTVAGVPGLRRLIPPPGSGCWLRRHLGVLGGPGLTAYAGVTRILRPKEGEQAFVSSAAGAVGLVAGQLLRLSGCRVVGSTGSAEKAALLRGRGFAGAVDYSAGAGDGEGADARYERYRAALAAEFPRGIDCYFDNVGGEMLDAVLSLCNDHARVAVCGVISTVQAGGNTGDGKGGYVWRFHDFGRVLAKQIRIEGFQCREYQDLLPEYEAKMTRWLDSGEVRYEESVLHGVERLPAALVSMLAGGNVGKQLVQVSADPCDAATEE